MSVVHPDDEYQEHLDSGRFMLLRSAAKDEVFFYPRIAAPASGARDLEWVPASGSGVVYSVTVISRKPPQPNYNIVLVNLSEGPRVMSRVVAMPDDEIRIGMPVRAMVEVIEGKGILVFEPAGSTTHAIVSGR